MVAILDRKFTGEVPRLPPIYRPPGSATSATNCDFSQGDLRPLRADAFLGSVALSSSAAAVRGLFYSREIGRTLHFPASVHVTRHTSAGVDRLYMADGVAPLATGKLSPAGAGDPAVLSQSFAGFGSIGPQAPEYTPQPMGDLKLSDYYMAGRPISSLISANAKHADVIAYNLRTYWAIRSKTGTLGAFYPSDKGTEDVVTPNVPRFSALIDFVESSAAAVSASGLADWQKATGFWNKYRDLKGSVYLADGEDIVLMVKVYRLVQTEQTTSNSASTEVPLGVAYSSNYNGGGGSITASSGSTSTGNATSNSNAGTAGNTGYQYPTVAEFPEFDTWSTDALQGLAFNVVAWQGNDEKVFDYSRALAAMSVLYVRGNGTSFTWGGTTLTFSNYLPSAEISRLNTKKTAGSASQQGTNKPAETIVQDVSTVDTSATSTGKAGSYTVTFVSSKEPARDANGTLLSKDASGRTLYALKASIQIGNVDSRSYCYTFVNQYGEESMPSPASRVITIDQGHCVRVSIDPPAGWKAAAQTFSDYACNPSSYGSHQREDAYGLPIVRIYRTVTASSGETRYHLFREVCFSEYICTPLGHRAYFDHPLSPADIARPFAPNYQWFDYIDQMDDKQAKEPLSTVGYRPPPGSLTHLQPFGNNTLCGVAGDELCFSEPLYPYAWPARNRVKVSSRIKAAESTANGVLLATEDGFSIATGGDVSTMAVHKLPSNSVLVGSSFARMGDALVAPTTDGLAIINGATVSTELSEKFWTPDIWGAQWVASVSTNTTESIGRYVGTFAHNKRILVVGTRGSFFVDLTTGSLSRVDSGYSAGHYANSLDALLVSPFTTERDIAVHRFAEAGYYRQMDFISRAFVFERPLSMGAVKIVAGGSFPRASFGTADLSSLVYVQCYVGNTWVTVTGTDSAPYVKVGVVSGDNTTIDQNNGLYSSDSDYYARLRGGYLSTRWRYRIVGYTAVREIHIAETMREIQSA